MQAFSRIVRITKATATLALVSALISPVLGAPLATTPNQVDLTHPINGSTSTNNTINSFKIQPRSGPRKRMLSWDALNSLHDTGNSDYISQITFQLIPSYHNWHGWHPADLGIKGLDHVDQVPQRKIVHDESELYGNTWDQIWNSKAEVDVIGFFNEPERSGMTPERAASLWEEKMVPLRAQKGKKLMSPGCADSGLEWCDKFIGIVTAKGQAPDFQAVHFYAAGEGSSAAAMAYLNGRKAKWPGMDVVVLEIASIDRSQEEVYKFTAEVTNWMDETSWIKEYAWFGFMPNFGRTRGRDKKNSLPGIFSSEIRLSKRSYSDSPLVISLDSGDEDK